MTIEMEKPKVRFVNVQMLHIKAPMQGLTFKTDLDLEMGDLVVCDTRFGAHLGQVTHYVLVEDEVLLPTDIEYKYIIQKVDMTQHCIRCEKKQQLMMIKSRMLAIQEREDAFKRANAFLEPLAKIAEHNPVMEKLLDSYVELSNELE